ncbi:MAG: PLP-dependent aminotransferase family protein [Ruminococcaceae bacterium]|nr:PLP-dependent aminotransferase family protein [Oscillospiraceae bacterium]
MNYESMISEKMKGVKASAIREIFKVAGKPDIISFAGGLPAPESFPVSAIKKICEDILTQEPVTALQYGVSEGYMPLIEEIKKRLEEKFNIDMTKNEMIVVSGSQQGADLLTKVLINEGDGVVCEEPSFIGCLNTFRTYKAELYGVPTNENGMDTDILEETLKKHKNIKMIYTIPTFQNPSGNTATLQTREKMLALAQKYNVIIMEDNPYGELRFTGEDVPTIKSLDKTGHVVYIGSFSKVFSPGLRLAYMVFDKGLAEKIVVGKQATDVHTNIFSQMIAARFLKEYDIDESIAKSRDIYKHRCELMLSCMDKCFPKSVTYTRPQGGIFIWVTLPEGTDTLSLMKEAVEKKVAFVPGNTFMTDIDKPCNSFRLNYSTMPDEKIIKGIEILGELLKSKFD